MGDNNAGISFVLDTSNQHPKVKPEGQKEEFLVVYHLEVDDKIFRINGLIWAKDSEDAFNKMPEDNGGNCYKLHKHKVIGAVKDQERRNIHDKLHDIGGGITLP